MFRKKQIFKLARRTLPERPHVPTEDPDVSVVSSEPFLRSKSIKAEYIHTSEP